MLRCFFSTTCSGRADLFEGLAVSRDQELMSLQGTFPTITVSFSGVKGECFIDFLTGLAGRIAQLFSQYTWLLEGNALSKREKSLFWDLSSPVPDIPDREKAEKEYAGYIRPVSSGEPSSFTAAPPIRAKTALTLTNHESLVCLYDLVNSWFETASGNYMERFADALRAGDLREMNAQMQQVVLQCASSFDSGTKPAEGAAGNCRKRPGQRYFLRRRIR